MTIRIALHQVCDRCGKPYSEEHLKYGENVPKVDRKPFKVTHGDHVVLTFEDLCDDCDRVVQGLVKRIKLEPDSKKREATEAPPTNPAETASVSETKNV